MKNHRIGNDINVKWSIFSEGAPYNLEGLQVTLYLKDALGKRAVTGFSLQENNVLWRFAGKDQAHTGRYSLELVVNEGKTSMITTDVCNFVNLVQHSCMIGGSDASNIETDSISLTSDLGSVPVIIDESLSEVSENAIANKVVTIELNKKADKSAIPTKVSQLKNDAGYINSHQDISHLATKEEVEDISLEMSRKQDKISDLDAIRSGASKGSTALQSIPAEYVTDDELKNALRNKVNKTDMATINGQSIIEGGDIEIQGGDGSYDDTELRNEIAQKASTEGYYPKMEVGKADNLPDRVDVLEGAITFRESAGEGNSIEDGTAEIKELCGDTIVWNQLCNKETAPYSNIGLNGAYSNGVWTYSGTTTASNTMSILPVGARAKGVAGHKMMFLYDGTHNFKNLRILDGSTYLSINTMFVSNGNGFIEPIATVENGVEYSAKLTFRVFDLTQMFGAGNEPSTIEEFYKRIPVGVDLYAYNEGEIVNVNINGIKSVNDNAWDEKWELGYFVSSSGMPSSATDRIRCVNPIHILPNQQYHFSLVGTEAYAFFYDENMEYISYKNMNVGLFTTPSNAKWMRFYVEKSYGTTYKNDICIRLAHSGYKTDYVPHEEDTMLIDTSKYFPQGMNGINGVRDSLSMNEKVQRFGVVKMKDLNWILTSSSGGYNLIYADFNSIKVAGACACTKYSSAKATSDFGTKLNEKSICVHIERSRFVIKDSSFSTSDSFKGQLTDNDYIYYELDEPIVEEIYPPLNLSYKVWDFGTEEILTEKSAPLITKAIYGFNATDTIRGNKAKIAQNTEEIVKLRNEIAQAIGNVINGEY